jgi:hypothetical protein
VKGVFGTIIRDNRERETVADQEFHHREPRRDDPRLHHAVAAPDARMVPVAAQPGQWLDHDDFE